MKKISKILGLSLSIVMVFSLVGCASTQKNDPVTSTGTTGTSEDSSAVSIGSPNSVPDFKDIVFPDTMPKNPTLAEAGYYDYDDMSVHYDLEFYTYNYGTEPPKDDPIKAWLEKTYNVTLKFTTSSGSDMETILSTRFSSDDVPDLTILPNSNYGFSLGSQGLLTDASEIYPYLPQTCKFVTNTILKWSTMEDGTIPFISKYAIQDGDIWGLSIRQDWLTALGMNMPATMEDIAEYAKASTFNDPDGNGKADTYFMTGAGSGKGFGMLEGLKPLFGNPSEHAENGTLVSPMLDGSTKGYIEFLNKLYQMNVLAPDWFTIDWETAKSFTLKDKIGMVNYPSGALYQEYVNANNNDYSLAQNWSYLDQLPEGTKGTAGGNAGECFAIPKSAVKDDAGKLKRICHILDAMAYGGEAYFATVQGGGKEVHEGYTADVRQYNDDGSSYCYVDKTHPGFTKYGTDNLALAPWQIFGYTLKWQKEYCADDADADYKAYVDKINEGNTRMAGYDRWPNDSMLSTISGDIAPNINEYVLAQEYKFITGERNLNEWDDFVQEYLDKGGLDVLTAKAEKLGCDLPAELKK
ncbi:extracellular solute-binding protein [Anaerocolumna sp. MB42-C2]|uniref:extracellular solute-binding protein n=1 Tax=Anaerocolumna sp. MB42-C2 TaxID=3070997 RepID=UPI0027E0AEC2|nr:extracellular solute-binding protein [Anaerocolumna sp. MB42-C2]WMJ86509.1 extracellular solute-binding protein [Anaerocolumna sp. MB42-C2]